MNKRKSKRYDCDIDVVVSCAEVPGEVATVKNSFKGRIKNISLKGIEIEIGVEGIKKGMVFNVEIVKENIRCVCVVRYAKNEEIGCQVICFPTKKMHEEYNKIVTP